MLLRLFPLLLATACATALAAPPVDSPEARFQSVIALVDSLMAREDYDDAADAAIEHLQHGTIFQRHRWRLHQRAGLALQALGRYREALDHLEKAVLWAQTEAVNHRNLATLMIDMDRPGRAMSEYREACELDPGNQAYLVEYAHVLMVYGQHELARRALEDASALCEDCPEVRHAWSRLALDLQDHAAARPHLERLLVLRPDDAEVRSLLALVRLRTDDADGALGLLAGEWEGGLSDRDMRIVLEADRVLGQTGRAVALALSPGETALGTREPAIWAQAALICIDADRDAEALVLVDRALALAPDDVSALNNRVLLLRRLGRDAEADRAWERLLELDPSREETP